ncbi:nuclear transport factor 2 family protein [Novosphingobium sp. KCTC 2891]|uniref:nuclear transport factor 2 family protein n=1 Tax=Novosphingobium sp. KCTC 2891 TaxID=2989730 RepID=UPI00222229E9|nr:nuclear transport factor 2 family protein [Novosphingobium sp. KCTC 2891]MCW1384487.1 nuclear transport factor 2 family protein [Novosphingobium sp. KCTC 2891]
MTMDAAPPLTPLDRIASWHAIYDLACDYMRAQDRLDPALHRSVFHDDATTDYGEGYRGDADGFVAFAQGVLAPHKTNHHMIGQVRIDFESTDIAFGEIYFQAHHRVAGEDGSETDMFVAGRYVDRYERRGGTWKIAHRSELVDWVRNEPAADLPGGSAAFPWGQRAPDDLSCRRAEMRVR